MIFAQLCQIVEQGRWTALIAARDQFSQERATILTARVPALEDVCLMAAQYMGRTMRCLVLQEIGGVQVFADRVPMEVKMLRDGTVGPALTVQGPDRIIARSPTLPSLQLIVFGLGWRDRYGWLNRIRYRWRWRCKCGRQVAMVLFKYANERISHILDEVKTVGNLQGIRSALACAVGIRARTVAANDLNAGMI